MDEVNNLFSKKRIGLAGDLRKVTAVLVNLACEEGISMSTELTEQS
jgi:hypothetical protein